MCEVFSKKSEKQRAKRRRLAIRLINEMTGHGIIHRSCRVLIGLAFEKMGMNRITIKCAKGNNPSEKIACRLDFTFEGIEKCGERFQDHFFDLKVFSFLKSEFLPE